MAVDNGSRITGIRNVNAKRNFDKKVESVELQISFHVWWFSDSSEVWIPKASEKASAIAIVRIPPSTTDFECVPE